MIKEQGHNKDNHNALLFTDSSFQDCPDTSRSTGCYACYLQGGAVDIQSFVPLPVAMSSAEAEYNAAAQGTMAMRHLMQIWNEGMGQEPDKTPHEPIPLFCDSTSAIAMIESSKGTKLTRHIQRRYHYVRQACSEKFIEPLKINGESNPADIGTKPSPNALCTSHTNQVIHTPATT